MIRFILYNYLLENIKLKTPEPINNSYPVQFEIDRTLISTSIVNGDQLSKKIKQDSLKIDKQVRILLWTKYYRVKWLRTQKKTFCRKSNCVLFDDRKYLNSSDAILFHWFDVNPNDLPPALTHQKWVLYNVEPPHQTNIGVDSLGLNKFDWIMNYRTDSDVNIPYGEVFKCKTSWKQRHRFERKTKSIAWFVSHCETPSDRETYAKIFGQYIDIDIYGKCGPLRCHQFGDYSCYKMVAKNYKFYLSFENSAS